MRRDNAGLYAFASGSLWSDAARERELRAFVRLGEAEDRIHDIRRYVGAGVVFSAPVARLIEDQFGLAVALAEPGAVQRRVPMRLGRESIVELTYRHVLAENLNLRADVQLR